MKIGNSFSTQNTYYVRFRHNNTISETINSLAHQNQKTIAGEGAILGAAAITGIVLVNKGKPDKYIKALAKDLSSILNKKITPEDLSPVMTKKEFAKIAKSLKEENYIPNAENIKKGIFIADFHSHSNYSDGITSVKDILEQAKEYGDKLNKINGKKFLFALTDHDGIGGVKEALKIIAENPKRYKNIKFLAGAELSFPLKCEPNSVKHNSNHNQTEMAEMLIYGINPFSKSSEEYFKTLYQNRKSGVVNSLKIASEKIPNTKFLEEEYNKFFLINGNNYCMLNQHWRIYQYINLKTRIALLAKEQNKNPEELYQNIMPELKKMSHDLNGNVLDRYFNNNNIPIKTKTYLDEVDALKPDICPYLSGDKIIAPYESSVEKISKYAKDENAVLGFAHPGFTVQNMTKENAKERIKEFINISEGRLMYSENFHQAYPIPNNISNEEVKECNELMKELKLIPIGGRDMHRDNFKL